MGVMLYEMVAGRPPFLGDDDVSIISQHINTPPVAAGWHNPGCPKPLEALLMRLLAKNPLDRPESAAAVLASLQAIDLTAPAETGPKAGESSLDLTGRSQTIEGAPAARMFRLRER